MCYYRPVEFIINSGIIVGGGPSSWIYPTYTEVLWLNHQFSLRASFGGELVAVDRDSSIRLQPYIYQVDVMYPII